MEINNLQLGKVGEYLVCTDLILQGYIAYLSEQGLHYDVVVDVNGKLLRIQVKTTRTYRAVPQRKKYAPAYLFNVRRYKRKGRIPYKNSDIDIIAFVELEDKIIGYIPIDKIQQTMQFRIKKYQYRHNWKYCYLKDFSFKEALNEVS